MTRINECVYVKHTWLPPSRRKEEREKEREKEREREREREVDVS